MVTEKVNQYWANSPLFLIGPRHYADEVEIYANEYDGCGEIYWKVEKPDGSASRRGRIR